MVERATADTPQLVSVAGDGPRIDRSVPGGRHGQPSSTVGVRAVDWIEWVLDRPRARIRDLGSRHYASRLLGDLGSRLVE